jgi:hypothetical protein
MATKKMNELTELTEVASDDLVMVFDASETGSEKTKKYPVQSLKSDLTSMDPSSFGNWVKIAERSGSIDGSTWSSSFGAPSLLNYDKIMVRLVAESIVDTTANFYVAVGEYDGTTDGTGSNYSQTAGLPDNRMLIHGAGSFVTIESIYDTATKTITSLVTGGTGSTAERVDQTIVYHGSKDGSMLSVQCYGGTSSVYNGKIEFFGWQEVKPIELHSYELVKEYNLNNETLDDTFEWDGEANPECIIYTDIKRDVTAKTMLHINADTGSNYDLYHISPDGDNMVQGYVNNSTGITLSQSVAGRTFAKTECNFSNRGEYRLAYQTRSNTLDSNTDYVLQLLGYRWKNTADNVTSLKIVVDANETGNIKFYRLAKTHLFNQTIYNDTTLNVATTGSNTTGDGSTSKPFASLGGAISWLKNKTINTDVTVTIQFADGTYNNQVGTTIKNIPGRLVIKGNSSNPAAVTLNFATNQDGIVVHGPGASPIFIYDMTLNGYDYAQWKTGISAYYNCVVYLTKVIANNFGTGVYAFNGANFIARNNCVFNGCYNGLTAQNFAVIDADSCTLSNNVNNGIAAQYKGQVMTENCTFTGNSSNTWTATGGVTAVY